MSLFSKKWISFWQPRKFFKILNKREKILFLIFFFSFLFSFIFLLVNFYFRNTEIRPASGGIFIEGLIGQPRFLNPIYAQARDIDRDLVELIFSGLMKYDGEGKIVPDLAREYKIEEGKIFEVYLKENLLWSDQIPLTVDDIIFTIKIIQDPDYKSPLRAAWLGVETEKISDKAIRFKLKNPSVNFLENLTLKILPKHIWEKISPENFPLSEYNLKPIGSGPFKFKDLKIEKEKIVSLNLIRNKNYHQIPHLEQISFQFFENETDLIKNLNKVNGFSPIFLENYQISQDQFLTYKISLPRYFAIFFNLEKSKIFSEKEIRKALNCGVNKIEILEKLFNGQGKIVDSPILPEIFDINPPSQTYQFNQDQAKEILDGAGFLENQEGKRVRMIKKEKEFQFKNDLKLGSQGDEVRELQKCLARDPEVYPEAEISGFFGNLTKRAVIKFQEKYKEEILEPWGFKEGTGMVSKTTREKLNEICFGEEKEFLPLKFSISTGNQKILVEIAKILKNQLEKLGAEIEIKEYDLPTLEREVIKKRDYEALLFGQVLTLIPDPFPFWHSLQKIDPGLNLSLYENKIVDKILEETRQNFNFEERAKKYQEFQDILIEEAPAIFLINPDYLYFLSKEIKGVNLTKITDPSKRFCQIEDWYIKTKRAWK